MKKAPHVIWVCPTSRFFYRSKGEVKARPGSVIPKLVEEGIKLDIVIPNDPTLLPKTKLSSSRTVRHTIRLAQEYNVDVIKLTRGSVSPGIYMVAMPSLEPALENALYNKAAIAVAEQLKRPVDIFHIFDWEGGLLPLFLELQKNGSRIFKNTRTFLNVDSFREHGGFAPTVLSYLGVPSDLFHPEGLEFFGRVSFLKAGLLFADGIGLVENHLMPRGLISRNGHGFEGVLETLAFKLRRWASDRSLRSHLEAYKELLANPPAGSVLPRILKKVHTGSGELKRFIESWGPPPPDRTNTNALSFLVQSPTKAYAFWEWTKHDYVDYGLSLENCSNNSKKMLARGLQAMGDFWIDVNPATEYVIELIGFSKNGKAFPLLRSQLVRTPRNAPSPNRRAVFVDVRSKQRFEINGNGVFASGRWGTGGTSALEWNTTGLPSSYQEASR